MKKITIKANKAKKIKHNKLKKRLMPICFACLIIIATIVNNFQNYCKAINNELYNALKTVLNSNVAVQLNGGEVVNVDWNEYLTGVLAGEMSPNNEEEALAAQALVSKNYACFHLVNNVLSGKEQKPVVATTDFQVYLNKEERKKKFGKNLEKYEERYKKAIDRVKNLIITYTDKNSKNEENKEKLINSVYFSESGNKTEDAKNVWGNDIAYLKSVDSSFEKSPVYKIEIGSEEAFNLVKTKNSNATKQEKLSDSFKIKQRNNSDHVQNVNAFGVEMGGNETRQLFKLKSTDFTINVDENNNKIVFNCVGFGHGVGMSQRGANCIAKKEKNPNNSSNDFDKVIFEKIIKYYYSGVEIKDIENLIV